MHIGIDCDEVLADVIRHALSYHGGTCCGVPIERDDIYTYYIEEMDGVSLTAEEVTDWYFGTVNACGADLPPVSGAVEVIAARKEAGHTLSVVTARTEARVGETTHRRLDTYFPEVFDDVIFTNEDTTMRRSKGEVCRACDIDLFVEDNMYHATKIAAAGIPTYLLAKPRNASFDPQVDSADGLITRVAGWYEVRV